MRGSLFDKPQAPQVERARPRTVVKHDSSAEKENCARPAQPVQLAPPLPFSPTPFLQANNSPRLKCDPAPASCGAKTVAEGSSEEVGDVCSASVSIPVLWTKGETPRVDQRGRVVKPPATSKEDLEKQEISTSSIQHTELPVALADGEFQEDEEDEDSSSSSEDEEEEMWSPTVLLSPTEDNSIYQTNGQFLSQEFDGQAEPSTDHGKKAEQSRQTVGRSFEDTSFLEFGCDHVPESVKKVEVQQDVLDRKPPLPQPIFKVALGSPYVSNLGASMNPQDESCSLSQSPSPSPMPDLAARTVEAGKECQDESAPTSNKNSHAHTNFTPRRVRSMAENDAAKEALNEANATLARLDTSPSPVRSPTKSPQSAGSISSAKTEEAKCQGDLAQTPTRSGEMREEHKEEARLTSLSEAQKALEAANKEICRLQTDARRADELEVKLQRSHEENSRLRLSTSIASTKVTPQQDERRKLEQKNRFLEEELENANTELSRTKAKLSSTDIELQVMRSQFEKMDSTSLARSRRASDRDLYSSTASHVYSASSESRLGGVAGGGAGGDHYAHKELEAQLQVADAERRALERGVQSLHLHASSLREENLALHQSLRDALAKLANLTSERGEGGVSKCPGCGTEVVCYQPSRSRPVSRAVTPDRERKREREMTREKERETSASPSSLKGCVQHINHLQQWHFKSTTSTASAAHKKDAIYSLDVSADSDDGMHQNPGDGEGRGGGGAGHGHVLDVSCESL